MIHVIATLSELPKGVRYTMTSVRPADGVECWEFSRWLNTIWFVEVK